MDEKSKQNVLLTSSHPSSHIILGQLSEYARWNPEDLVWNFIGTGSSVFYSAVLGWLVFCIGQGHIWGRKDGNGLEREKKGARNGIKGYNAGKANMLGN